MASSGITAVAEGLKNLIKSPIFWLLTALTLIGSLIFFGVGLFGLFGFFGAASPWLGIGMLGIAAIIVAAMLITVIVYITVFSIRKIKLEKAEKANDDLLESIKDACEKNKPKELEEILHDNPNIDVDNLFQGKLLLFACTKGYLDIFNVLIKAKADVNRIYTHGYSLLHIACEKNQLEIVKALFKITDFAKEYINRDTLGLTPLMVLIKKNPNIEIAKILLNQKNIDVNFLSLDDHSALGDSCRYDDDQHVEIIKLLLAHKGIDINKQLENNETALHVACRSNNLKVARLLLEQKNIERSFFIKDSNEKTPIDIVLNIKDKDNRKQMIDLFLKHKKFDLESIENKDTVYEITKMQPYPLHFACRIGDLKTIEKLLKDSSIKINEKDGNGQTPLDIAMTLGAKGLKIANLFIEHKDFGPQSISTSLIKSRHCFGNENFADYHFKYFNFINEFLKKAKKIDIGVNEEHQNTILLNLACHLGREDTIKLLLERDDIKLNEKDSENKTPFDIIISNENLLKREPSIVNLLVTHKNFDRNLAALYEHGYLELVKDLLKKDVKKEIDVNKKIEVMRGFKKKMPYQESLLDLAYDESDYETIKFLLLNRADNIDTNDIIKITSNFFWDYFYSIDENKENTQAKEILELLLKQDSVTPKTFKTLIKKDLMESSGKILIKSFFNTAYKNGYLKIVKAFVDYPGIKREVDQDLFKKAKELLEQKKPEVTKILTSTITTANKEWTKPEVKPVIGNKKITSTIKK